MSGAPPPPEEPAGGARLALELAPSLTALAAARDRVRELLERRAVAEATRYAVELVLEELAGNAVRHGYAGEERGVMTIEVELTRELVRIRLTDDAPPFDPTVHPEPPPFTTLEEAPIGGLGISMVRKVTSAMRYRRADGRNHLEVEVRRAAGR